MAAYTFKQNNRAFGVTPLPNIFIDEYMPSADGNFVKVYLAGLIEAFHGNSIQGDVLARKLGLIESDVIRSWDYWESKGLVRITRSDEGSSIEFLNVSSTYAVNSKMVKAGSQYQPEDISLKMSDPNVKDMHETIQKLMGRILSVGEISTYLSWMDDYGFPPEVIILLIEYCKAKNKADFRYIEKVALSWHDAKVQTIDDAQKHVARHEEKFNKYRLVLDFLGLKENDLMKPQEEFLDKWFNTYGFNLEIVLEACKICSLRINEPNFNYIDGILTNWSKKGVKAIQDIDTMDVKKKTKNVKFKAPVTTFNSYDQRSYDIKELEKKLLGRDEVVEDEQ